jgi:hypothetical protein
MVLQKIAQLSHCGAEALGSMLYHSFSSFPLCTLTLTVCMSVHELYEAANLQKWCFIQSAAVGSRCAFVHTYCLYIHAVTVV